MKAAFPELEVLTAENVPEDDNATRVMEDMISKGAKIIFATSYGHLDPATKVAAAHPDVVVMQQGNLIKGTVPANLGTYFGTVYEPVYLAGIAAGKATKTNKLGYVYAFPITQTTENIDAFQLGAASVNPAVQTITVATSDWCNPAKQAEAANSLLAAGCRRDQPSTRTAPRRSSRRPRRPGRLHRGLPRRRLGAGAQGLAHRFRVERGDLSTSTSSKPMLAGDFTGSKYNDNYRVGLKTGDNPFVQSVFGPSVTDETKAAHRDGQGRHLPARRLAVQGPGHGPGRCDHLRRGHDARLHGHRGSDVLRPGRRRQNSHLLSRVTHVAGTRPYPWPYDGVLDPARLALVVAGGQAWFSARTVDAEEVLGRLRTTAKVVRDAGGVVVVLHHECLGPGPRPGEHSGDLVITIAPGDSVVDCVGMSGFSGGPLDGELRRRGIDRLAVGGLGMETAVYSTLGAANDRGYECLALADASAFHDDEVGPRAIESITMSGGIFAAVGTTTALCDALLEEQP